VIRSFTIVTTSANDMMAPIHDRMPVMIPEDAWERWLDPARTEGAALGEPRDCSSPRRMARCRCTSPGASTTSATTASTWSSQSPPPGATAREANDGRRRVAPPRARPVR
jgi:putative SOS response-associated peptidase YedK